MATAFIQYTPPLLHPVSALPRVRRVLTYLAALCLMALAVVVPSAWTSANAGSTGSTLRRDAWLQSAILRPIRVNDHDGILLWLHTDPAFAGKLQPVVAIPDLPSNEVKPGFVAIQGHGEVFRGEHYLLVEGVHQWVRTADFVAAVRRWLGYDAQVLLIACNPDHVRLDIPNTIYWKDNLVDVTYGIGPWVEGKYIEDDPDNGHQWPVNVDTQPAAEAPQIAAIDAAIARLHAAIGAQEMPADPAAQH